MAILDKSVYSFTLSFSDILLLGSNRIIAIFQTRWAIPADRETVYPCVSSARHLLEKVEVAWLQGIDYDVLVILRAEILS